MPAVTAVNIPAAQSRQHFLCTSSGQEPGNSRMRNRPNGAKRYRPPKGRRNDRCRQRPYLWQYLLVALGLWLGLEGQPVWATSGIYPTGAGHEESHYQLQAIGPTVLLNLTAVHAPVQHQARQKPTILLHVPKAWRPAALVSWEVEGWPVLVDGRPDPQGTGTHVFTL